MNPRQGPNVRVLGGKSVKTFRPFDRKLHQFS